MVTGTQINVKSRIEASKLISTAAMDKSMPFLLPLVVKEPTAGPSLRNKNEIGSGSHSSNPFHILFPTLILGFIFRLAGFCPHFLLGL